VGQDTADAEPSQVNCWNCDTDITYSGQFPDPFVDKTYCGSCRPDHRLHAHTLNAPTEDKENALPPEQQSDPLTWAHCADCHGDVHDHLRERGEDTTGSGPNCGHWAGCPNC
jgi:hypothetical protein